MAVFRAYANQAQTVHPITIKQCKFISSASTFNWFLQHPVALSCEGISWFMCLTWTAKRIGAG